MYDLFKRYGKTLKYIDWKNILKIIWGVISKRELIITGFKSGEVIEKMDEIYKEGYKQTKEKMSLKEYFQN